MGVSISWNPQGLPRPVMELLMGDKRNTQKTLKVSLKEGGILKYPGIGEKKILIWILEK
jgi:hypothetical protein